MENVQNLIKHTAIGPQDKVIFIEDEQILYSAAGEDHVFLPFGE